MLHAARHEGMIMMVMGAGRPGTIKIKATIAADEVHAALAAYHLSGSTARSHEIYFCEQPSQLGLLPLLDAAVILRVLHHPESSGEVTVKLRPCRPGQLSGEWSAFRRSAHHQLRIKGEWAHDRRVLAASLVYSVPGDHLRQALQSRPHNLGRLFSSASADTWPNARPPRSTWTICIFSDRSRPSNGGCVNRDTTSPPNDGPCSPPATHQDLTSWNCP